MTRSRDMWWEFLSDNQMCGLCGQYGIIDTTGIKTPAGVECGVRRFCICPNGRAMKNKKMSLKLEKKEL